MTAEWCEHDPIVHPVDIEGKRHVLHVYIGTAIVNRHLGNRASVVAYPDGGMLHLEVLGPPCEFTVTAAYEPQGERYGDAHKVYAANERVVTEIPLPEPKK
jgi:hypothetical protein